MADRPDLRSALGQILNEVHSKDQRIADQGSIFGDAEERADQNWLARSADHGRCAVQKAKSEGPGLLRIRQPDQQIGDLFILVAQKWAVAIPGLADPECAAGHAKLLLSRSTS